MGTHPLSGVLAFGLAGLLAAGCTGTIERTNVTTGNGTGKNANGVGDPGAGGPGATAGSGGNVPGAGPGSGDPNSPGADPSDDPNAVVPFAPAGATLRRLTVAQYQNTVRDLLGDHVQLTVELEADTAINGFVEIGAARTTLSPSAVEKYESAAFELAEQALTPERRVAFVGCEPRTVTDGACTRAFVARFGRRALRRPLTQDEIARYASLADEAATALNNFWAGIPFAVAGLLQSPSFLFRVELGEPDPANPARLRYSGYEMAGRLSYLFWNTTPDDMLLDAAEAGELTEPAGLAAQVARLAGDERTRAALANFHLERLGLDELATVAKDSMLFPQMNAQLADAMREDILRTIEYVTLERGGDFRELLTTRVSFVNGPLAQLYGLPAPGSGTARAELPADGVRLGLLGKAGLLAVNAHVKETSPTRRGKFVRERVLCQSIPAPPPNVVTVLPEPDPNAPTMRDRLKTHRSEQVCAGCHALMDPIGLAFENFDALGKYRADDDGHALDLTGDVDGDAFDGPEQLASMLHDDPEVTACMVRQLYRYATAHVEEAGEEIVIRDLAAGLPGNGHRIDALLQAIVASDGFRYAKMEAAP